MKFDSVVVVEFITTANVTHQWPGIIIDFSAQNLKARTAWKSVFQALKGNNF